MIISLEVEEGFSTSKELKYLAEGLELGDFSRKALPVRKRSTDNKQSFDRRNFVEITISTYMASEVEAPSIPVDGTREKDENKSVENRTKSGLKSIDQKPYFSGNPSVEVTKGILHLYKIDDKLTQTSIAHSDLLCMLAVPAKMSCTDLLSFISPLEKYIEHIRVIRDSTPNLYMTLLKFKNRENAHEFYDMFNGRPFNTLEPDVCHLVYVCKVESTKSSDGASLPLEGAIELPVCHICLERMDESVEGVLTVLCNHSFHGSCLVKWQDSICPVCRCLQTPEILQDNKCLSCDSRESLWICLICGHIGCGRYRLVLTHDIFFRLSGIRQSKSTKGCC